MPKAKTKPKKLRARVQKPGITHEALATRAGVEPRTIRSWVDAGCPTDDELAAAWWIVDHYHRRLLRSKGQGDETAAELRIREQTAKTDLAEEKLRILQGAHIPAAEVEETWCRLVNIAKQQLRSFPQIARRLYDCGSAAEISRLLKAKVREALEALAGTAVDAGRENGPAQ